jgi:hypothetical protein
MPRPSLSDHLRKVSYTVSVPGGFVRELTVLFPLLRHLGQTQESTAGGLARELMLTGWEQLKHRLRRDGWLEANGELTPQGKAYLEQNHPKALAHKPRYGNQRVQDLFPDMHPYRAPDALPVQTGGTFVMSAADLQALLVQASQQGAQMALNGPRNQALASGFLPGTGMTGPSLPPTPIPPGATLIPEAFPPELRAELPPAYQGLPALPPGTIWPLPIYHSFQGYPGYVPPAAPGEYPDAGFPLGDQALEHSRSNLYVRFALRFYMNARDGMPPADHPIDRSTWPVVAAHKALADRYRQHGWPIPDPDAFAPEGGYNPDGSHPSLRLNPDAGVA